MTTLAYWDSRGYAQSIRLMLAYAGVDFVDKRYSRGPGPTFAPEPEWVKDKADGLGLHFPNIPYLMDGDIRLSQSMAISRYLARKYGLIADSEESTVLQDLAEYQLLDFRTMFVRLAHSEYTEANKMKYVCNVMPVHLEGLAKFLGEKSWLTGEKLNFVDFMLYDILDWHLYFEPKCLEKYPNLAALLKRVEDLPSIKTWMTSGNYKRWPLFGPSFKWGYATADQLLRFPELAEHTSKS